MTAYPTMHVRTARWRLPWTRGAMSGLALMILGAWAAIVPFIGPYLNFAFTPNTGQAWYWTAARGYMEVIPGAAAFLGGILLLVSRSRAMTSFGGWLGIAAGAWLVVGPALADLLNMGLGHPDPAASTGVQAMMWLFYFYAIGGAIILVSGAAVGRLSVVSVRDVRAAERRAAVASDIAAAEGGTAVADRPVATERTATDRPVTDRPVTDRPMTDRPMTDRPVASDYPTVDEQAGRHDLPR